MQTSTGSQAHRREPRQRGAMVPLWGFTLVLVVAVPRLASAGVNVWTSTGPEGTVVNALAADPLASGTVYAGSAGSGVFKTVDRGATWQPANIGLEHTYVESIAVDPTHPATLYAASASRGVFVSTDGAQSWRAMNAGLSSLSAHHLALDAGSSTLYVATTDGVFRSTAGGPWAPTALLTRDPPGEADDVSLSAWIDCLAIDPTDHALYACFFTWSDQPGPSWELLKSIDGGATWHGLSVPTTGGPVAITIAPSSPASTLYIATYEPMHMTSAVLCSRNGGATWDPIDGAMPGCEAGCRVDSLAVGAQAPAVLYAATDQGVYARSEADAGWAALDAGMVDTAVTSVVVDGLDLYAATSDGVYGLHQAPRCGGDCNGDGAVRIPELVTMVDIVLGEMAMDACTAGDAGSDGQIGIDDVVGAVAHALAGCAP